MNVTIPSGYENTATTAVLALQNLTKRFGEKTAVDGLSFSLQRGEILALLGPNGAGKTTTVELCEGFLTPDEGSVRVFGLDPAVATDPVRSRIGIMLQGGGAYPGVRVGEMLRLVASYSDNPLDVDWLLGIVGLTRFEKTPYRRLSGGQQQRLSLACALVGRPELIFLDEPTAGLDAQSRLVVWDLVRSLRRDGVSVVLTTHLMDEAESLADRVIIIDKGRVVADGTPAELTSGSAGESVVNAVYLRIDAALEASVIQEQLRITNADATVTADDQDPHSLRVEASEITPNLVADISRIIAAEGVLIRELTVNKQSLEDIFLNITGREIRA